MEGVLRAFGAVDQINNSLNNATGSSSQASVADVISPIVMTVFFIVGIIAVVMIIIGGIQYATSQGDSGKTKRAKDIIMYSIIGLVVSLMAFAIVTFVLDAVSKSEPAAAEEETEESDPGS